MKDGGRAEEVPTAFQSYGKSLFAPSQSRSQKAIQRKLNT